MIHVHIYWCIWYWVHGSACLLSYIDSFLLKASLRSGTGWDQSTPNIASHLEGKNGSLSFEPFGNYSFSNVLRLWHLWCQVASVPNTNIIVWMHSCCDCKVGENKLTRLKWQKRAATGTDELVKVARLSRWIHQKLLGIQFLNQRTWQELETPLKAGPSLLAYPGG